MSRTYSHSCSCWMCQPELAPKAADLRRMGDSILARLWDTEEEDIAWAWLQKEEPE